MITRSNPVINITLTTNDVKRIRAHGVASGLSRSMIVRQALALYFNTLSTAPHLPSVDGFQGRDDDATKGDHT